MLSQPWLLEAYKVKSPAKKTFQINCYINKRNKKKTCSLYTGYLPGKSLNFQTKIFSDNTCFLRKEKFQVFYIKENCRCFGLKSKGKCRFFFYLKKNCRGFGHTEGKMQVFLPKGKLQGFRTIKVKGTSSFFTERKTAEISDKKGERKM